MKKILTAFAAILALSALTACGKSSAPEKSATKTVSALNGKVKIPAHPKRVVIQNYPDEAQALGANVVGTDSWSVANPYLTKKIPDLGAPTFNLTKLIAAKPDLIVTVDKTQVANDQKIAPTVLVNYQNFKNLHDSMDYFAKLLGREKEEKAFFTKFDKAAKAQQKRLSAANIRPNQLTATILELQGDKIYAYGDNFARGGQALTTGLGFKPSSKMAELSKGAGYAEVNAESLKAFDADYLFVDYANADKAQYEALEKNPVWRELKAVKQNHVITMDYQKVYFYGGPQATLAELPLYTDAILKSAK